MDPLKELGYHTWVPLASFMAINDAEKGFKLQSNPKAVNKVDLKPCNGQICWPDNIWQYYAWSTRIHNGVCSAMTM